MAALDQIEVHRQRDNHDGIMTRCMKGCQQSVMDVERLVGRLGERMAKSSRGAGKMYAAMKGDDIKELLNGLERSKSSLQLAYMMYIHEEQRHRDHVHLAVLVQHQAELHDIQSHLQGPGARRQGLIEHESLATESEEDSSTNSKAQRGEVDRWTDSPRGTNICSCKAGSHKRSNSKRVKVVLPSWMCSRIWDLALLREHYRWTMHLATYNKVSEDAPVLQCIWQDDIEGLKRLFADGLASPLDVYEEGYGTWTLLETAAQSGKFEICQLLIDSTSWPDESEVMNRALEWFAYSNGGENSARMYRLFLGRLTSLISLREERGYFWLAQSKSRECFEVIQREFAPAFYEDQLEARFELAVRTSSSSDCAEFLRRVGPRDDPRLARLTDKNGRTVLHCVAGRLWKLACCYVPPQELQDWVDLRVNVLQNGADPYTIAKQDPEEHAASVLVNRGHDVRWARAPCIGTPLLECIDINDWGVPRTSPLWLARTLETLRIWVEMMERGGYDLLEYASKETEMWHQLGITDLNCNGFKPHLLVHGLSFSSSPKECDLQVRWQDHRNLRRLHSMPGTIFQASSRVPNIIAWLPNAEEDLEGPWSVIGGSMRFQDPVTLSDIIGQCPEPFIDLHADPESLQRGHTVNQRVYILGGPLTRHHKSSVRGFLLIISAQEPGVESSTA
ncbi:hypothetical protein LTR56_021763 [Elasticomyces elasticus]|nr:hypothetical protein LTR56_021763 [Elasticomyces elasticus]